jgi:cytoskeletal protein RodZ
MTTEKDITLGEFLRHERERRGITIDQVASATKVGVRTLHSLEADHFADLPAKPFVRGFVTSYCRFIGLEPKEVLGRFEDFICRKSTAERPNREGGHSGYAFERKDGDQQSRTVLMIAVCSFIVVGGLAMIFLKPSLRHRHHSHIDKLRAAHDTHGQNASLVLASPSPLISASPVAQNRVTQPVSVQSPAPVVSPSPEATRPVSAVIPEPQQQKTPATAGANPDDPLDSGLSLKTEEIHHKIIFKTLADIWVRYQVDDRPMRKFIVRKGKSLVLRANQSVQVQVSNPHAVSFNYNGKKSLLVSDSKSQSLVRQGAATLFFPHELAEKIDKPFGDDKALPQTADPISESLDTTSTANP